MSVFIDQEIKRISDLVDFCVYGYLLCANESRINTLAVPPLCSLGNWQDDGKRKGNPSQKPSVGSSEI